MCLNCTLRNENWPGVPECACDCGLEYGHRMGRKGCGAWVRHHAEGKSSAETGLFRDLEEVWSGQCVCVMWGEPVEDEIRLHN